MTAVSLDVGFVSFTIQSEEYGTWWGRETIFDTDEQFPQARLNFYRLNYPGERFRLIRTIVTKEIIE